jgi:WD40 repeat protein
MFDKATLAWTLPWDADWITAVRFIGATRKLAAGNNLGQVLLWDLPEKPGGAPPAPIRRLDGHTNVVSRLLSTNDGRWLISSSYDHTIRTWDVQAPVRGGEALVLNQRARDEAAARRSSGRKPPEPLEVKVDVQPSAQVLEGHKDWIQALTISKDETLLLSGDDSGNVIVWDRAAGKELRRWPLKGWAYAVALSPDNKQAFVSERRPLIFDSGRYDGVKLWDVATGQPIRDLGAEFKGMYLSAASFAPDGKLLAVGRGGEGEGKLFLVDPATGKKVRELTPLHQYGVTGKPRGGQFKDWIHAVSFSADGRWLAAADMAGAVQVWSLEG